MFKFPGGGELPCLLVENKAELVGGNYFVVESEMKEFANNNGFCGGFEISVKEGMLVHNAMEFLIKKIIERIEPKQEEIKDIFFSKIIRLIKKLKKQIKKKSENIRVVYN